MSRSIMLRTAGRRHLRNASSSASAITAIKIPNDTLVRAMLTTEGLVAVESYNRVNRQLIKQLFPAMDDEEIERIAIRTGLVHPITDGWATLPFAMAIKHARQDL